MRKGKIINHLINAAIFIILEIAALNMLRNNAPLQDTWFANGGHAFMETVWGISHDIKGYFLLRETNNALALENQQLRTRLSELENLMSDSRYGQTALEGGISDSYHYIPATIEKISNNTQHNYIIIGKGYDQGVSKGAGLITGHGAIGVIDAVSRNFSYARSFKNHGMSVSARLGKSGAVGSLVWDGIHSNGATLKEVPLHMALSPGDTVYTSGYSSIFPPDIPLGKTGESRIVNGSTCDIDVMLFEDFSALRYVTVVENLGKEEIKSLEGKR